MSTFDYSGAGQRVQRLLDRFGRQMTFVKRSRTAADPAKPWRGNDGSETTVTVNAVMLQGTQLNRFGLFYQREFQSDHRLGKMHVLVAGNAFTGEDAETFDEIRDGSKTWAISNLEALDPGDLPVLYDFTAEAKR